VSDRNPSAASDEAYVSHHFDAPPEVVFAAWTDPEQVARWWAPRDFEIPPESVDIEPRVGGRFHLEMVEVSGPGRFSYRAEIVEFSEPVLIVLKAEPIAGTDIEETITRVELVAEGGATRMTVTSGPFTPEARENAQTGWDELVVNLERVLAAGPA
jgi:uncharacterized protein YndB with AHSA1/START domain